MNRKNNLHLNIFVILLISISYITGCAESSFILSKESRLPKWFKIPKSMSRSELKVTMDYYVNPSGREVIFKLYDNQGKKLDQMIGYSKGTSPIKLKNTSIIFQNGRPIYEIITVNGITDIIEHRDKSPIFYITDDTIIWKELNP